MSREEKENETESVFMNIIEWEPKSRVSAFSYWELSYATNVATRPHPVTMVTLLAGRHVCF